MSEQTFACPACGSRKTIVDPHAGEKIHCTCGMSFPASPVFAVPEVARPQSTGPSWAVLIGTALVAAIVGFVIWKVAHNPMPAPSAEPAAANATPADQTGQPTEVASDTSSVPPADGKATPPDGPTTIPPADKPAPPSTPPVAVLRADTLFDAYDVNPAVAATYTGKVLEVTARGKIARDSFDRPYFGAEVVKPRHRITPQMTAEERQWEKDGYPPSVRCYLAPEAAAALEHAPPDQEVVLRGVCTGRKNMDHVYLGYVVELNDCKLVNSK